MKISSDVWLHLATKIMPQNNKTWLKAMEVECSEIKNPKDRNAFAAGCFKTALLESARSRKTLNYMARGFGAAGIFIGSNLGIFAAIDIAKNPEHLIAAKIILALCLFYMCGAALLVTSLKALKIYAATGLCLALMSWIYIQITNPIFETLSSEFISALNIETAGLMGSLLFAATYLSWLYKPHYNET